MFERYTEKARRTIFFARYEAAQFGSPKICPEHLLLGLLREDQRLYKFCPNLDPESLRAEINSQIPHLPSSPTTADLPLDDESKRVLKYAADEADRLASRDIGTEHLLLGLLDEENCLAAKLLAERGARPHDIRQSTAQIEFDRSRRPSWSRPSRYEIPSHRRPSIPDTVEIHGHRWNAEYIQDAVKRCREISWHWHKCSWSSRDIVVHRETGKISFDLSLAETTEDFDLVKGGWRKDHCAICRWELSESKDDPEHGSGFTNGLEWICSECYGKFIERDDFFHSNYYDIT
jgi:hypothetical protein